jgi:hypothetical protein
MDSPGHSFFDFWKLPDKQVVFTAGEDADHLALVKIYMPEPSKPGTAPALYQWGSGHFYASLSPVEGVHDGAQILNASGQTVGGVALDPANRTITLPFNLDEGVWHLLNENYIKSEKEQVVLNWLRKAYYALKPLMPRGLQMALRRKSVERMALRTFPAWPVDGSVDSLLYTLAGLILTIVPGNTFPMISFWPRGYDFCLVLSHDVETQMGFENIDKIVAVERRCGVRSVWNIVAERYPVDEKVLQSLRADGYEIGVHGLRHDGKMFQSRHRFLAEAKQINNYIKRWDCSGFRSPSLLRNLEWLSENIHTEYDSSFPASEFYGAQPGGCCTVFPFICPGRDGRMVELPITLQEDHTLLETLGLSPETMLDTWLESVKAIKSLHGMVLLIAHPDYLLSEERLKAYETFLQTMKADTGCWCALPKEVASWWRQRHQSSLVRQDGAWVIEGPAATRGQVMDLVFDGGLVHLKPQQPFSVEK